MTGRATIEHGATVGVAWMGATVLRGARRVVDAVDLSVTGGSWVSLLGPNGAGKTTLVRTLAGRGLDAGTVHVGTRSLLDVSARERARLIAVVPQHPVIPPGIAVFDYVLLGRAPHQGLRFAASEEDRRRTHAVAQRLDLDDLATRTLESLSGGERQRVVLARALAQDTPVLVLDEPTTFLDVGHQLAVLELIAELRAERGLTVITTMHDLSVAGHFADTVAVMSAGRLVAHGCPAAVLTPDLIETCWGVAATTSVDGHGGVTVAVQRRRETPLSPGGARPSAPPEPSTPITLEPLR